MIAAARAKRGPRGRAELIPERRAAVQAALAVRRAAEGTPAEDHAALTHDTAVNLLATTWFPGYDEPARKVGAKFRPFAISALGGYGPDAMVAVSEMTHPGDELLLGEPGERWEASTTVFNTRLHRHHLIQAAAVAFWAATYDAVQSVANGDPVIPWPGAGS